MDILLHRRSLNLRLILPLTLTYLLVFMHELRFIGCDIAQFFLRIRLDIGDVLLHEFLLDHVTLVVFGLFHHHALV